MSRIGRKIDPRLLVRRQVREHARVEHRQQPSQLGFGDVLRVLLVARAGGRSSTGPSRPSARSTSLNSGLPSRETCTHGPCRLPLSASCRRTRCDLRRLAVAHTPITACGSLTPLRGLAAVAGEFGDRDLQRDRVHVEPCVPFTPTASADGIRCRCSNGPQRAEVEDAAEVDEERVGALAGEDHARLAHRVHGGCRLNVRRSRGVLRGPMLTGGHGQVGAERASCLPPL